MPTVADALLSEGYRIDWHPRLISTLDTAQATHVISIGCDHDAIPTETDIIEWDVPLISHDLLGSLRAIHRECEALAERLAS